MHLDKVGKFLVLGLCLSGLIRPPLTHADGAGSGGGGDAVTEKRIKDIRDNLLFDFINKGGDQKLDFKGRLNVSDFENGNSSVGISSIKELLAQGAVVVNAIKASDQNQSDELKNTFVEGARKICKSVPRARKDGRTYIICEAEAFGQMSIDPQKNADLQTVQVAHEYFGLAGVENNVGSDSDYWLSGQLTAFMRWERVRKLGVESPPISSSFVKNVRKQFSSGQKPTFQNAKNLIWTSNRCQGQYLTNFDDPSKLMHWDNFPEAEHKGFSFARVGEKLKLTDVANLPLMPATASSSDLNSPSLDRLALRLTDAQILTFKLSEDGTLLVEVALSAGDGSYSQVTRYAPYAYNSIAGDLIDGGQENLPFAYFICKQ